MIDIFQDFPENSQTAKSDDIARDSGGGSAARSDEPTPETGKVSPPRRVVNRQLRTREHLTPQEGDKLMKAASRIGRYASATRPSFWSPTATGYESANWWRYAGIKSTSSKGAARVTAQERSASTHPLRGPEIRALRRLRRDYPMCPYSS